jgi:HEAT repeat protein
LQWHAARALSVIGPGAKDAVPALTAALKSSDADVRGHAANALENIGTASHSAANALAGLLDDKDGNVRRAAMDALLGIGLDAKTLVPILKHAIENPEMDPSLTVPAMNALAEQGDEGIKVLIGEMKNEKGCYWATVALGTAGPKAKDAVPDLLQCIGSAEPEMRMEAALTLGNIGPDAKSAIPALTKALTDKEYSVRYAAAYALAGVGAKDASPELRKQADSKDPFLKITIAWALAKLNPDDQAQRQATVKILIDGLKDKDRKVRVAAARGLHDLKLPPETTMPVFAEMMADKDPEIRDRVADALASLGESAMPKLIKALDNDDMQALAVEVIRRLGPKAKSAVPALILEMKDPGADYRREVEFAIGSIGPDAKAAVPTLIEHLTNEKEDLKVRRTACYALGKIGPAASEAVPALQKTAIAEDKFLKVASVWALLHIQPENKPLQTMAIPLMAAALTESDRDLVKEEAAAALGLIGPSAKEAIPALEKAAKEDASPAVREAAQSALKKIRGEK